MIEDYTEEEKQELDRLSIDLTNRIGQVADGARADVVICAAMQMLINVGDQAEDKDARLILAMALRELADRFENMEPPTVDEDEQAHALNTH